MIPYVADADFTLYVGDVREVLAALPDGSVDCCVTSPPYLGLRDYGMDEQIGLEGSIGDYVAQLVAVFADVRRVLAPQGTLWLNLGDSYNAYNGGAGPGSKLSATQTKARPRLASGFGLQQKELKPKDLMMVPARVAIALCEAGWYLRSEIVWCKPAPMPESVRDRPTQATERIYLLAKSQRYHYDGDAIREPAEWARWGDQTVKKPQPGTASWIKPKSKQDLTAAAASDSSKRRYEGFNARWDASEDNGSAPTTRNAWNWWVVNTQPYPDAHFATWPEELVRRMVLAGCPEGGTVLDPFMGSGTTALVARRLGRKSVGIELNPEYAALAAKRLQQLSLLAEDVA